MLTARVASGRLTRFRDVEPEISKDRKVYDDLERDPQYLFLVHWHSPPFIEGSELTAVPPPRPQVTSLARVRAGFILLYEEKFVKFLFLC